MPLRPTIRVCHLIHDLRRGGAEHLLADLAAVAGRFGLEMTVVSAMMLGEDGYDRALRQSGVEVVSLGLRNRWDPRGSRRLRRALERLRPDLLHAHLKHADLLAARVAPRLGIPFVSTLHVIEDGIDPLGRFKRWAATRARRRFAVLTLAVSDAVRDWYLSTSGAPGQTVVTLRNGVANPPRYPAGHRAEIRARWGVPPGEVVVATVAVLRPGKGIDDLLETAAGMTVDTPVRFVVAGSGPEKSELVARARELGLLDDRVMFVGFVEDVAALLDGADLLVHPSHRDALPTAVIHGMAAGLPVVATDVGGTPELVTPDVGVLVQPGDPARLRAEIESLIRDPEGRRRMGERARRRFEDEFSVEIWAERLRSWYDRVLSVAEQKGVARLVTPQAGGERGDVDDRRANR